MTLLTLLLSATLTASGTSGLQLTPELQDTLHQAFVAPGATWVGVVQPFWPDVRVFKLASVTDQRWYHRPTVAIDASGKAHVITDNIFMVPPKRPLAELNAISRSEHVIVDSSNAKLYAHFFLLSYLVYRDTTCLSSTLPDLPTTGALPATLCSETQPFRLSTRDSQFVVDTVLIDRASRGAEAHRFVIAHDGQVSFIW